jgi:predicted RNA-binding Zn ribbon-like protein
VVSGVDQLPRYQRLVDGLVLPASVAGDVVLDFCNTRAGWGTSEPREYLVSYDHLAVWAREAELVGAEATKRLRRHARREPDAAARRLEEALSLRSDLYAALTDPRASSASNAVVAEARTARAATIFVRAANPGRRWRIPESGAGLALPMLELALAAAALLDSPRVSTIGRCPGHDCGWLFLDPRGRRRWCSMEVCGNRAKARRHAARARG